MEYYGYAGSILYVDLANGETKKEPLDIELARKFVGGWGINFKLAYDLMKPGSAVRNLIADRSDRISNLIKECIQRGKKDGSIRKLPPEKTAFILRGMLNGLSRLQMLGVLDIPELGSEVIDFCRLGLERVN